MTNSYEQQMKEDTFAIMDAVDPEKSSGLTVEIFMWAFNSYRENPELTIAQAINEGFNEWVK